MPSLDRVKTSSSLTSTMARDTRSTLSHKRILSPANSDTEDQSSKKTRLERYVSVIVYIKCTTSMLNIFSPAVATDLGDGEAPGQSAIDTATQANTSSTGTLAMVPPTSTSGSALATANEKVYHAVVHDRLTLT